MTISSIDNRVEEFTPIIRRVARRVANDYRMIEAADLEQELFLLVFKRAETIPLPSEANFSVQSLLTRHARQWAFQQKQQHFMINPAFCYEVKDIRDILETHFDKSLWDCVTADQSVEEKVAGHSDVAWALDRLAPADKEFVANCYAAERLPKSGTPEYRKLRELIIKIANIANHYSRADEGEGPGRREIVSNSKARAMFNGEID